VAELKEQLSEALKGDDSIILDASEVDGADAAALQLLVAFIQQASLKKRPVEWHEPAEGFLNTVKLMGLNDALNIQI